MTEISLPKQLSGPEVLDSLVFELKKKLRLNGRFHSHMAYPGYRAEITVRFYPAASFIPELKQDLVIDMVQPETVVSQTPTVEQTVEIPVRSPNQTREDADMPTPVLVMDENGQAVEKWVKRKPSKPKNVYKGGSVEEGSEPAVTMVPTVIA